MTNILQQVIYIYTYFLFGYFVVVNTMYVSLIALSWSRLNEFIKIVRADQTAFSGYTKPVSLLVPAYNEVTTIVDNIQSLLDLDYPQFEVVVINDGSKDDTLKEVIRHFGLRKINFEVNSNIPCEEIRGIYSSFQRPELVVIDKANGGKADALNAGINVSRYPLFCAVDADSIIEKDALFRLVKSFLKYSDTIAVGGIVRIANGCHIHEGSVRAVGIPKKLIEKFQIIEYFRAFLTSRVGWQRVNALLIISGAFGLFSKNAVVEVGGYRKTIGEDMELTVRMHEHFRRLKKAYRIDFVSDAVCWTQAPDNLKDLRGQRIRWHRGLADALLKNIKMLFNPRYGTVGMLAMPYFFFVELLGPVIELIGYVIMAIGFFHGSTSLDMIYIFLMAYLFGIFFSFSGIFMEELAYRRYNGIGDIVVLFGVSLIEQFIYRQLTVVWRVSAFFNYKKSSKRWGTIDRKHFNNKNI
ncbi:glycosyltransferase family 2 protein [Serpentinicella alkaliphila]|uniref:Cellulose synthase/poly-beta-1,6-N-acetylglucosamine synthase-like glycosyltransferase n=1 Tax=Serpentinicella alkaliphila TaxID=1734049 RepID=A0A4R2UA80_9FIRM|nr:glycosyltransferase [Serpentinicella alkaliphila]QUH24517.1 glycosyltransferase family 2 protein [Serpentinicella alkaliphila]TCQ04603.1 cellulose synthase/poly-beta-1,6-N-acetylglucosamine synthase-like glycosyltransferase [Serpentinicella alkaliphila]